MAPVVAAAAGRTWQVLENHWFRSLTDADTDRAIELAEEMDRFRIGIQKVTNAAMPAAAPPALVIIFATAAEFKKYSWSRDIGGYALSSAEGLPEMTIVVPATGTNNDERQTIRHEYVHALNRHRLVRFPQWYEEGIAEVLSLVNIDGADITVGLPPKARFQGGMWRSFDDIVSGNVPMHDRTGFDAYAQYWILAHYLTYGRPDLRESLNRCLVLSDGMMQPLSAFRTAFGMTPEEMWKGDIKKYAARMPARRYTLKSPILAERFVVKPADPAEVQNTLAALMENVSRRKK